MWMQSFVVNQLIIGCAWSKNGITYKTTYLYVCEYECLWKVCREQSEGKHIMYRTWRNNFPAGRCECSRDFHGVVGTVVVEQIGTMEHGSMVADPLRQHQCFITYDRVRRERGIDRIRREREIEEKKNARGILVKMDMREDIAWAPMKFW